MSKHTELGHGFQASLNSSRAQPAANTTAAVCFCCGCRREAGPGAGTTRAKGRQEDTRSLSPSLAEGSPPASEAALDGPVGGGRSTSDQRVPGREVEGLVQRRDVLADSGMNAGTTPRSRFPCRAGANACHGQRLLT